MAIHGGAARVDCSAGIGDGGSRRGKLLVKDLEAEATIPKALRAGAAVESTGTTITTH